MIFKIITSLLLITAIVCFLKLTPESVTADIVSVTTKKATLREKVHALKSGKKKQSIGERLLYVRNALNTMKKGNKFTLIVCLSVVLFAAGAVLAVIINNLFLIPTFAAFLGIIPFIYVRNSLQHYEKHITDELSTTLETITIIS